MLAHDISHLQNDKWHSYAEHKIPAFISLQASLPLCNMYAIMTCVEIFFEQ